MGMAAIDAFDPLIEVHVMRMNKLEESRRRSAVPVAQVGEIVPPQDDRPVLGSRPSRQGRSRFCQVGLTSVMSRSVSQI